MVEPKVKICGVRSPDDAEAIAKLGVDYIGMIFYNKSPRYVTDDEARLIVERIRAYNRTAVKQVKTVGVFVNMSPWDIRSKSESIGFDIAQLHGNEQPSMAAVLKDIGIFKAIRCKHENDLDETLYFQSVRKDIVFLLDTYSEQAFGGVGQAFDYDILVNRQIFFKEHDTRYFIAGGLRADNIHLALKFEPYGLDLNSGVEHSPGVKDLEKVAKVMRILRGEG